MRGRKCSIPVDVILETYLRLGNVHLAGKELGISHATVHRYAKIHSAVISPDWTDKETEAVRLYYTTASPENFCLYECARIVGRPRSSCVQKARSLGLTDQYRPHNSETRERILASKKGAWAKKPHPRGALGLKHTDASKAAMSLKAKEMWSSHKKLGIGLMSPQNRQMRSDRSQAMCLSRLGGGWNHSRVVGGRRQDLGDVYFRSSWEANYARYLNWLVGLGEIEKWEYEPETFKFDDIKRGIRSYTPDFKIYEKGTIYFVEVKGWMDPKSKTRLSRFAKRYPHIDLRVFGNKEYRALQLQVQRLIPNWEVNAKKPAGPMLRGVS